MILLKHKHITVIQGSQRQYYDMLLAYFTEIAISRHRKVIGCLLHILSEEIVRG